jgi:hypothetical protein
MTKIPVPLWMKSWVEWRSLMWNLIAAYLPKWVAAMISLLGAWYLRNKDYDWGLIAILTFISFGVALWLIEKAKAAFLRNKQPISVDSQPETTSPSDMNEVAGRVVFYGKAGDGGPGGDSYGNAPAGGGGGGGGINIGDLLSAIRVHRDLSSETVFECATPDRPAATPDELKQAVIRQRTLHLYDVPRDRQNRSMLIGKTFEECNILGPCVLIWSGTVFHTCTWQVEEDKVETIIWKMPKHTIIGAIGLRDCIFRKCTFIAIGIAVPKRVSSN